MYQNYSRYVMGDTWSSEMDRIMNKFASSFKESFFTTLGLVTLFDTSGDEWVLFSRSGMFDGRLLITRDKEVHFGRAV